MFLLLCGLVMTYLSHIEHKTRQKRAPSLSQGIISSSRKVEVVTMLTLLYVFKKKQQQQKRVLSTKKYGKTT